MGLGAGTQITGWAFTQFDGTVYWDKAGLVARKKTEAEKQLDVVRGRLTKPRGRGANHDGNGRKSPPRKTFVLNRGQYDQPSEVEVGAGRAWPMAGQSLSGSPWLGQVDDEWREPADVARHREPALADALRHRHREVGGGFWRTGRVADTPRVARLAGHGVRSHRLEPEGHAQADRDVGHVPAVVACHAGTARGGSGKPTVCTWTAFSFAGGNDP